MRAEALLDNAANAVLDRDAPRTLSTVRALGDQLSEYRANEREHTKIYHNEKQSAVLAGMIATISILVAALWLDQKVLRGGLVKISLCFIGLFVNCIYLFLVGYFDGQPGRQRLLSGLAVLPPVLECIGDVNNLLSDKFTLDPPGVLREKTAKLTKFTAEALKALLAAMFLFWIPPD